MAGISLQLEHDELDTIIRRVVEEVIAKQNREQPPANSKGTEADDASDVLLLKPARAAEYLGMSERKLWELQNKGMIPHVRIGRATRYDIRDLQAWVDKMKIRKLKKEENDGEHIS